ncbi:MAG: RHS repeat-associated core domain-containing protein, partial [Candidatus Coproplasma sp.]
YYDPTTGRFISPDNIDYANPETVDGLNLYAYCDNNPVMNVAPEGHFWFTF